MPGKAAKIQVTERQLEILHEIVASRTAPVRLVQRAKIVLLAFAKHNNEEIGEHVGLNPQQASVWRKRWRDDWSRIILVECNEPRSSLQKEIETLFADQPRKGRTSKFTTEQQASIVAIACENPFPAAYFPETSFNHMVLKAVFTEVALARILGLATRRSPELARMATDYASERTAAGRSVPADLALVMS